MQRSLHEYKQWRSNLEPLKIGSIIQWKTNYHGITVSNSIKSNQYFIVTKVREPLFGLNKVKGDLVYDLTLCSKNGHLKKKHFAFSVEAIASFIEKMKLFS